MPNAYPYVEAIAQVAHPPHTLECGASEKQVEKVGYPRAKAEIIANRTQKTITEKMDEDPFFYRKFSTLLQQAIDDYKSQRINETALLARVTEVMEQVRDGRRDDVPEAVRHNDLAKAFYGALKDRIPPLSTEPSSVFTDLLAEAACAMEAIIHKRIVVGWKNNEDAKNRMRNDFDDLLYDLQKTKSLLLTPTEMDAINDAILHIAQNRQDV